MFTFDRAFRTLALPSSLSPTGDIRVELPSVVSSTLDLLCMLKHLAITSTACILVVLLAVGINTVPIHERDGFLFWWAVASIPACVALPLLGRFHALTALAISLSTAWLGMEYIGDGDVGPGLVAILVIAIGIAALFATFLTWGYARGIHL